MTNLDFTPKESEINATLTMLADNATNLLNTLERGTLVLQGAFYWTEGSNGGHDWEDIPTIIEAQEK